MVIAKLSLVFSAGAVFLKNYDQPEAQIVAAPDLGPSPNDYALPQVQQIPEATLSDKYYGEETRSPEIQTQAPEENTVKTNLARLRNYTYYTRHGQVINGKRIYRAKRRSIHVTRAYDTGELNHQARDVYRGVISKPQTAPKLKLVSYQAAQPKWSHLNEKQNSRKINKSKLDFLLSYFKNRPAPEPQYQAYAAPAPEPAPEPQYEVYAAPEPQSAPEPQYEAYEAPAPEPQYEVYAAPEPQVVPEESSYGGRYITQGWY
jgi:hypothetical protein